MVVGLKFVSIVYFTFCCWYHCECNFLVAFFSQYIHPDTLLFTPPLLTPRVLAVLFMKCKSKKYIALRDRFAAQIKVSLHAKIDF